MLYILYHDISEYYDISIYWYVLHITTSDDMINKTHKIIENLHT